MLALNIICYYDGGSNESPRILKLKYGNILVWLFHFISRLKYVVFEHTEVDLPISEAYRRFQSYYHQKTFDIPVSRQEMYVADAVLLGLF